MRFLNFLLGGLYALGGYTHFTASVELSRYRKAVMDGCASLHKISASAHQPGLVHLYEAVMALERHCIKLEDVADSQLRAMGTNEVFASVWHDVDLNLFSPEQLTGLRSAGRRSSKPKQSIKTFPRDPITTPTTITNNVQTRSTQETTGKSELVTLAPRSCGYVGRPMPAFKDEAYQRYCRSQSMPGEVCCST